MYNTNTEKVMKAIAVEKEKEERKYEVEWAKLQSLRDGMIKGMEIAEKILECEECRREEDERYEDGAKDMIYMLGAELDITIKDIVENFKGASEAANLLAERISKNI